jgi:peptidoglycan/LPS O-acetylase OafA/YrhL
MYRAKAAHLLVCDGNSCFTLQTLALVINMMPNRQQTMIGMSDSVKTVEYSNGLAPSGRSKMTRLPMLDGWRGISILAVLACHLLPLGPKRLELNGAAGLLGMALFFTLSGFLITTTLIHDPSVRNFIVRRVCRIVPLVWLYTLIVLPLSGAAIGCYPATLLFYANLPPFWLGPLTGHLWSICVEMQFYLFIAILFGLLGKRGLLLLLPLCLAITTGRIINHKYGDIVTYYRADEILAVACLGLVHNGLIPASIRKKLMAMDPLVFGLLLLAACHPYGGALNYFRPYLAASLVGTTIYQSDRGLTRMLQTRGLAYVGEISYALYIIHPLCASGWLGAGRPLIKYAKRPLSFGLTFGLAHLSTRYYESRWIALGKRHIARMDQRPLVEPAAL